MQPRAGSSHYGIRYQWSDDAMMSHALAFNSPPPSNSCLPIRIDPKYWLEICWTHRTVADQLNGRQVLVASWKYSGDGKFANKQQRINASCPQRRLDAGGGRFGLVPGLVYPAGNPSQQTPHPRPQGRLGWAGCGHSNTPVHTEGSGEHAGERVAAVQSAGGGQRETSRPGAGAGAGAAAPQRQ